MMRDIGRSSLFQVVRGAALSAFAVLPFWATAQDIDLVNATLVDGTGAAPRAGVTVSIRDGKIAAIHPKVKVDGHVAAVLAGV